jgi:glycosyltransferase involved in cell wall biosynthesis
MDKEAKTVTREQINQGLTNIYKNIGKKDSVLLHKQLDEIFYYKPVDNYYTYVRASLFLNDDDFENVWMTLSGKDNWYFPGPYAPLLAQIQYEACFRTKFPYEAKMYKILSYYTYVAATTGINSSRKSFFNEDFISETEACYEGESAAERILLESYESDVTVSLEFLEKLFSVEYNLGHNFLCIVLLLLHDKYQSEQHELYDFFWTHIFDNEPNAGYLIQEIEKTKGNHFVIILDEYCGWKEGQLIAVIFKQLGQECTLIPGEKIDNTTLKNQLEQLLQEKEYSNLIASRSMFVKLQEHGFGSELQCLTEYKGDIHIDEICFGYLGGYTKYISRIYQYDYQKELEKLDTYLFSIIIPARNSAYTLQYTLRTILKQRGIKPEEYEIIISDNSVNGSKDIKNLVDQFHDARICYYITPVDLPLQRSFEFAYGKAKGKYIIPMGSDDGMLPWALETLKKMIDLYADQNIIGWERGFFQWTESQSPQKGKFVIPSNYQKENYTEEIFDGIATLLNQINQNGASLYSIPLLYINTAFRRSFLLELLNETGRILDGYTQDVSMTIKSLLFNKTFLYLHYPLTIAGMSDHSLGSRMAFDTESNAALRENIRSETPRGFGSAIVDASFPFLVIPSTEGMFWSEFFRVYTTQELKPVMNQLIEKHDFKETFITLTGTRSRNALDYLPLLEKLRYNAYYLDTQLGKWFEEVVYQAATSKAFQKMEDSDDQSKAFYTSGFTSDGGLILNAEEFQVFTIQDAVELFRKIVNL